MARNIKNTNMKNQRKSTKSAKQEKSDKTPILSKKDLKITKIFDEIDTGVSYDELLEQYGY